MKSLFNDELDKSNIETAREIVQHNEFISSEVVRQLLDIIDRRQKPVVFEFLNDDARAIEQAKDVTRLHSFVEVSADNVRCLIILVDKLLNIIKRGKP